MPPFALIAAALLAAPAPEAKAASRPPLGDCRDDDGVDRCDPEQQRRVRELFGVKSIEEHLKAGDEVRRAFFVDGYGRDVVAIEFIRARGSDPLLRVYRPETKAVERSQPLSAPASLALWEDLSRRSAHFDRTLLPRPEETPKDGDIVICLHSWVYTVEVAEPPSDETEDGKIRRKTEDACDHGLVQAFAQELEKAAVPLLPPCARLDRSNHRNEATLLAACSLLAGDRLAAAEVMNRLSSLENVDGEDDAQRISGLFRHDAKIEWSGAVQGNTEAAAFWARQAAQGGTHLIYRRITGESPGRVRFEGSLSRWVEVEGEEESRYEVAQVEQLWGLEHGDLVIERATVGPFERKPRQ